MTGHARSAEEWLGEYERTHQNRLNKRLHYVCVPLIFWSLLALLAFVPRPEWLASWPAVFVWPLFVYIPLSYFYWRLGFRYWLAMALIWGLAAFLTSVGIAAQLPMLEIAAGVFVAAWIGQFIGHKIERAKPSFFEDLQFLLVGPLWIAEHARERFLKDL